MRYFNSTFKGNRQLRPYEVLWKVISFVCLLVLFLSVDCLSDGSSDLEEISISLIVQGIGSTEVPVVIRGQDAYLSITDVFTYLKIKSIQSPELDSVSGFFITPEATFLIDGKFNRISYQDRVVNLHPGDLIRTTDGLYLRSNYFGEVFGLECAFNFRSLSVTVRTKLELPAIREMRLAEMRKNINRLKGETHADTIIGRNYPLFHFGMADWSLSTLQHLKGTSSEQFRMTLGGTLAGGETDLMLNANSDQPFMEKQQSYLWRYADNDNSWLRQIMAGKISTQAVSSMYSPVVGAQLTNTPTTYRRSFGTYTLSDYTEPDWTVELYVNNVLIDYVKADASGFFTFNVPLVYGSSEIKLRFYGPWGEERLTEQNIAVPYNFLPPQDLEYTIGGGMVEDGNKSLYSRSMFSYGVDRHLTVGGGFEHLSSATSGKNMPFVNTSLSLASSLLLSGEYILGVRTRSTLSYRLPLSAQIDLSYVVYDKNQTAINNNYLEERRVVLSLPFHLGKSIIYSRFNYYQIVLPLSKYTMADFMLAGNILGIGANLTTYASYSDPTYPYIYSTFSLSFGLPSAIQLRSQTQYDFTSKELISIRGESEKQLFGHAYLSASYGWNFISNISNFQVGLRYELPFAQTNASVTRDGSSTTLYQSAGGSLIYDHNTDYAGAGNRSSVGRGGIVILQFLDLNGDGEREPDEPKLSGLNFHCNGGRMLSNNDDTTIYIFDLEPYTIFYLELNPNSFENMNWIIQKPVIGVFIDPNQIKLVEVPVAVLGEISGQVMRNTGGGEVGLGRITVSIYDGESRLVASRLTESDGYFSYLGLPPGSYTARLDTAQLHKLQMTASPASSQFTIQRLRDGDVVDNLKFVIIPVSLEAKADRTDRPGSGNLEAKNMENRKFENKGTEIKDTELAGSVAPKVHEMTPQADIVHYFTIQIGTFIDRGSADNIAERAMHLTGYRVTIEHQPSGKYYTCYLGKFSTREQALDLSSKLKRKSIDFFDAFVLPKSRMSK
jgi:hypothetical protein